MDGLRVIKSGLDFLLVISQKILDVLQQLFVGLGACVLSQEFPLQALQFLCCVLPHGRHLLLLYFTPNCSFCKERKR
jgi:thioredoxin-related protein